MRVIAIWVVEAQQRMIIGGLAKQSVLIRSPTFSLRLNLGKIKLDLSIGLILVPILIEDIVKVI